MKRLSLLFVFISLLSFQTGQSETPEQTQLIDALGLDFAETRVMGVYERVAPSVVSITTQFLVRGIFDIYPEEGAGSGFIIDDQGHIITNYHVVDGATSINVSLADGRELTAKRVGIDPRNDVALLKVDVPAETLKAVELGSSSTLKVGQRAIAIGNPFGQFGQTLTTGVVSALNRSLKGPDGREITGMIQTDAAINRGNSGGPLLDSSGKVIGINTAIFSPSGTSSGVGFAVPVSTLERLLPDLLTFGRYRHPWLGIVTFYYVSPSLTKRLDLGADSGVLIVELHKNSPLKRLGVKEASSIVLLDRQRVYTGGDILIAVDNLSIESYNDLNNLLENNYQVGDEVTLTLVRGRELINVRVALTAEPD